MDSTRGRLGDPSLWHATRFLDVGMIFLIMFDGGLAMVFESIFEHVPWIRLTGGRILN